MTPPTATPSCPRGVAPRGIVAVTGVVVLFALALRLGMYITLYDGDTELFVYMGKLAAAGGRIGTELIDNKLPTVSLVMWPLYELFGSWWAGYWLVSMVMGVISVACVVRATVLVYPSSAWPTLAVAATWMSFPMAVFCAFKLEHVQLFTAAVAAWAFVRCWRRPTGRAALRDAFVVGLCAGVGAYAKPNALSVLAAAAVSVACWRHVTTVGRVRVLAAMAAGLALPAAVLMAYLVRSGALATFGDSYAQIRSYNVNSVFDPNVVVWKVAFVVFLIATPLLLRGVAERRGREPAVDHGGGLLLFAGLWLTLEAVGIVMQGRMYGYHFLPMTAPAAMLFGLIPRRPMAVSVVGSCLPVMLFGGYWFCFATASTESPTMRLAALDYVKAHAAPRDGVWVDQYARLLVESDLTPGSAVPLTFIFSNDDAAPTRFTAMICSDLRQRRPRWVILPADCVAHGKKWAGLRSEFCERPVRAAAYVAAWARLQDYVRSAYRPATVIGEYCVYERPAEPAATVVAVEP